MITGFFKFLGLVPRVLETKTLGSLDQVFVFPGAKFSESTPDFLVFRGRGSGCRVFRSRFLQRLEVKGRCVEERDFAGLVLEAGLRGLRGQSL